MNRARIRTATPGDIDAVLELWRLAEAVPSVSDSREGLIGLLRADGEALLLAESHTEVVGSLIAGWDGWRGSFYRLAVHPAHRRQGIASELLRSGESRLARLGAARLTAIVADEDPIASGFWLTAGYTCRQRRARFVRNLAD